MTQAINTSANILSLNIFFDTIFAEKLRLYKVSKSMDNASWPKHE